MAEKPAAIVFSAAVARRLDSDDVRLPPTHVGVRRVRPSDAAVRDAFVRSNKRRRAVAASANAADRGGAGGDALPPASSSTTAGSPGAVSWQRTSFKVQEVDGTERRMTKREKKELKLKLRKEMAESKKQRRQRCALDEKATTSTRATNDYQSLNGTRQNDKVGAMQDRLDPSSPNLQLSASIAEKRRYHQLGFSSEAIDQELAELRGERYGIPPIILSGPMARKALQLGILSSNGDDHSVDRFCTETVVIDDGLASSWAKAIKLGMKAAEDARAEEDMRPMAYTLAPEVWSRSRIRPHPLHEPTVSRQVGEVSGHNGWELEMARENAGGPFSAAEKPPNQKSEEEKRFATISVSDLPDEAERRSFLFVRTRRRIHTFDADVATVFEHLHSVSSLHVSCGAKFGCDFLLYDGRREDRHAFAGLRIISSAGVQAQSSTDFNGDPIDLVASCPIPNAYDLAGYVRGLNTAGKLALIATVVWREAKNGQRTKHVAFVDLALEKIPSAAPTHERRVIAKNASISEKCGTKFSKKRVL